MGEHISHYRKNVRLFFQPMVPLRFKKEVFTFISVVDNGVTSLQSTCGGSSDIFNSYLYVVFIFEKINAQY